jgi:two-component system CheB/CheR fusion protein
MVSSFLGLIEKKYGAVIGEKGREYIHYATDGAARMRNVISDILEFSKIGKLVEPNLDIDLNKLMYEICLLKKEAIKEKKAEIKYQNLPTVHSQKTLLLQLFYNLISNALKYHQSDKNPLIEVECIDKGNYWEFAIKDNGIGIEEAYFLKIFEAFQRLHSKDEYSGSGIGLAICKKIVQTLKGDIWVESWPMKGSIFYVSLPKI